MQILMDLHQFKQCLEDFQRGTVISIGNFDGIHLGHKNLLESNKQLALKLKAQSTVITFDPHPVKFFNPEKVFESLFDKEDQSEQLNQLGIQNLFIIKFDRQLASLSALEFIDLLKNELNLKGLALGPNFLFGANRSGNIEFLKKIQNEKKFELVVPPLTCFGSDIVSTTLIKKLLLEGDLKKATEYLERPFSLKGKVEPGAQRGQQIGFPTVNIVSPKSIHLKKGVYKTKVSIESHQSGLCTFDSITNVGSNPTFNTLAESIKVETHIFNFNENIYQQMIKVEFIEFIREEKKFNSVDELKEQIKKDILKVRGCC